MELELKTLKGRIIEYVRELYSLNCALMGLEEAVKRGGVGRAEYINHKEIVTDQKRTIEFKLHIKSDDLRIMENGNKIVLKPKLISQTWAINSFKK